MNAEANSTNNAGHQVIQVADLSLAFRESQVLTTTPTGAQLAQAAGFAPDQGATVLAVLADGELEDVRPTEVVDLATTSRHFVVVLSDRLYKLAINGTVYEWPARIISGGQLRKLGQVPDDMVLYQTLPDGVERFLGSHDLVDLDGPGIEQFMAKARQWKLNVQGVLLTVPHPTIVVRQAITDAGFDATKPWIIVLRVHGEPKREVGLYDVIDLRTPGIEKLRLTPREVNNGEGAAAAPLRMFALLPADARFLDSLGWRWETRIESTPDGKSRRWLLIHNYPLSQGFTVERTLLALEIPLTYPGAQIDMFYTYPALALTTGQPIPSTQVSAVIGGNTFNGWSRHRGPASAWDPQTDNVVTHLALVESAMLKEVQG
ncbi:MAG: multiubiquitin domain-containing protein [Alphaproteobacteria bacterium]|nr:multiubiquitin domain-containing protein [Alphaproteobacteria bacterium]